jgi:hypothetical protein
MPPPEPRTTRYDQAEVGTEIKVPEKTTIGIPVKAETGMLPLTVLPTTEISAAFTQLAPSQYRIEDELETPPFTIETFAEPSEIPARVRS